MGRKKNKKRKNSKWKRKQNKGNKTMSNKNTTTKYSGRTQYSGGGSYHGYSSGCDCDKGSATFVFETQVDQDDREYISFWGAAKSRYENMLKRSAGDDPQKTFSEGSVIINCSDGTRSILEPYNGDAFVPGYTTKKHVSSFVKSATDKFKEFEERNVEERTVNSYVPHELALKWADYHAPSASYAFFFDLAKLIYLDESIHDVYICCMGGHGRTGTLSAIFMSIFLDGRGNPDLDSPERLIRALRRDSCSKYIEKEAQEKYASNVYYIAKMSRILWEEDAPEHAWNENFAEWVDYTIENMQIIKDAITSKKEDDSFFGSAFQPPKEISKPALDVMHSRVSDDEDDEDDGEEWDEELCMLYGITEDEWKFWQSKI